MSEGSDTVNSEDSGGYLGKKIGPCAECYRTYVVETLLNHFHSVSLGNFHHIVHDKVRESDGNGFFAVAFDYLAILNGLTCSIAICGS